MAQQQGAIRQNIVDIFVAVKVVQFAAGPFCDEGRNASHAAEGTDGAVDTAGDVLFGFCKDGRRFT